jgi:hypothetical protein
MEDGIRETTIWLQILPALESARAEVRSPNANQKMTSKGIGERQSDQ